MNTELVLSITIGAATLVLNAVAVIVSVGAVVAYNLFKQQAVEAAQKTAKEEMEKHFKVHNVPILVEQEVQKVLVQKVSTSTPQGNEEDKS